MDAQVLVVDDDALLTKSLAFLLRQEGYRASVVATAGEALEHARGAPPDLVILDIGLPDLNGVEACRRLRAFWAGPIIMLTGRRQDTDKVVGLDAGADDYVVKPFVASELLARIRAALRRARQSAPAATAREAVTVGGLAIDPETRIVAVDGQRVHFSAREFDLLWMLVERAGRVVSRREIVDRIWGADFFGDERALDVYIRALRKKVEPDPDHPTYIQTVRGVGYKVEPAADA